MRFLALAAVLPLILLPGVASADGPQTDLVLSGAQSMEMTASDPNACYTDTQNGLNAELTDPRSGQIISINVQDTVGDHPAKTSDGQPQLIMLGIDATQDNPIVNWAATGGTVTLDDVNAQVASDDGSVSTHGVRGHLSADLSSPQGALHISGPFACHLAS